MATATATNTVEAKIREASDKNAARRLRTTGMIPAVLYGAKKDPRAIAVDPKQILKILHSDSGHNTIFDINLDGEQAKAMVVDWQYEPMKGQLLHVDLKRIAMDQKMRLSVPVHIEGEAKGAKEEGGLLDLVLREIQIECLPTDIPSSITVDVTNLGRGEAIRVADLPQTASVKYLNDPDALVVHITFVKEEVAAPVEGAVAAAEPEVIKKGKAETEADTKDAGKDAKKK
ncbi:MAG TPA: 50S ribosomal protein L25 [Candidatus Saccharimonadales bacterium]|nr:50S ribosomal protein L25 [Candidatus Saccharimonadales bacterium]